MDWSLKRLPIRDGVKLRLFNNVRFETGGTYNAEEPDRTETLSLADAQVVSSEIREAPYPHQVGMHYLLLDLDVPAHLVPSSTPGHSHLYIEKPITWDRYLAVLETLAAAGVVEAGYVEVSRKRKAAHLRLPWVKKELLGVEH